MSSSPSSIDSYLWAAHPLAAKFSLPERIADRFEVIAPQIWRDTRPQEPLPLPDPLPASVDSYLRLFPKRLHIPEVYGVFPLEGSLVLLLSNGPIDSRGQLYPTLEEAWSKASSTRQVYWLWQILNLWMPLAEFGVAASLLVPENLRVEGWRIRLRELYDDRAIQRSDRGPASHRGSTAVAAVAGPPRVSLATLGDTWEGLAQSAQRTVAPLLQEVVSGLKTEGVALNTIANALNEILLNEAAKQPLRVQVTGASDRGRLPSHNEDSYYPTPEDLSGQARFSDRLNSHFAIVCDGIGGHEGGEVASHMAVQSLKLQVRSLLAEMLEDPQLMTPELVEEQLAATIRIANNAIAARNDQQGRESRRRMATTMVMALQLPQKVTSQEATNNSHELYIAHVGDSRAYWITPNYCQQLTVDDDVATREVRLGRSIYREARNHPNAEALTQALGTRSANSLRPTVQRFVLEEDGMLLLCSDGLSDGGVLEDIWQGAILDAIRGKISLESALEALIRQANEKNGRDNISIVAAFYGVSPQPPLLVNLSELPKTQSEELHLDSPAEGEVREPEPDASVPEEDIDGPIETEMQPEEETAQPISFNWALKLLLLVVAIAMMVVVMRWQINSQEEPQQPGVSPSSQEVE